MGIKGIFRTNLVTLIILIVLNLAVFSLGTVPWIIIGLLMLLGALFTSFRSGMGIGHEACAISKTIDAAGRDGVRPDDNYVKQAWSLSNGIRGALLSALIPYAFACLYIICTLAGWDVMKLPTRIVAWVLALPYWPIIAYWHEDFVALTPDIAALLMITPFVIPAATFAGYLQGPKLWGKTEKAMAEGRRRAKAKSRIVRRKKLPKQQKPEI